MAPTRTAAKKAAAKKTAAPNKGTSSDPNAGGTDAENPVETHELQEAAAGGTPEELKPDLKVQIVDAPLEGDTETPDTTTIDKDFVFMHDLDPARQIPGTNKYLDVEQRKSAEIDRAAVEGREPDLDNPPAAQGTPYRSAEQLAAELPPHATVKASVTLPVTVTEDDADRARDAEEKAKALQTGIVFNDPTKAQDRQGVIDSSSDTEGNTSTEGNSNAEGNVRSNKAKD